MTDLLWIVPAMLALMAFKGFFSGTEIALVSADKIHLRHMASQGHRGAAEVLKMERNPELYLATTLVGTNLSIVALSTLGTIVMMRLFGEQGEVYAILLFSPLFLILTEVVPKSIFQHDADRIAPVVIWPLRVFQVLLFPVVYGFALVARLAAHLVGGRGLGHAFMNREMIRAVLDASEKAEDIDSSTLVRLKRAVRLADVTVGEVMIPMAEVTAIGHHESLGKAIELARTKGHFRLPVYEDEVSSVVGVLPLDVWKLMTPGLAERPLRELVVAPELVVPQQPVQELLPVLSRREDRMAVVVDEFGSAIGMITLEDLQETIVGEFVGVGFHIPGYVHRLRHVIETVAEDVYELDGRVSLSEVGELLAIDLPLREAHTIGGFVIAGLRHLPRQGESVVASGYRFTVLESSGGLIKRLRVEPC